MQGFGSTFDIHRCMTPCEPLVFVFLSTLLNGSRYAYIFRAMQLPVKMRHEVALQVATSSTNSRMERKANFKGGLDSCPCLVLNADYQPLSYLPLR